MTNQYVWIGIAIGVFIAGIGIGCCFYEHLQSVFNDVQPQYFNQMMTRNPQFTNQYMGYMMQNPQYMQQLMSQNPQYVNQWMDT